MSKVELKRIDVLRAGVIQGIIMAAMGLIVLPFAAILALFGSGGVLGGIVMAILAPLVYGTVGFIGGVILAFAYNLVAKSVGGMILEFDTPAGVVPTSGPGSGVISS